LVVGYGNPLRSDDGAGPLAARLVEAQALPGTEVRIVQQLEPALVEDFRGFDAVVLVDAAADGPEVAFGRVGASLEGSRAVSHHLSPGLLAGLYARLYGGGPAVYCCSIRGESFEFGSGVSETAVRRVRAAAETIGRFAAGEADHA
jgi:hydrogenase maturation protease